MDHEEEEVLTKEDKDKMKGRRQIEEDDTSSVKAENGWNVSWTIFDTD